MRSYRFFDWVSRHIRTISALVIIAAVTLGVLMPTIADDSEPNFDPEGEIFTAMATAESTLVSDSTVRSETFIVEAADGGDVLTAAALSEWHAASDLVRNDATNQTHLVGGYDADLGTSFSGVMSLADLVDDALEGQLATATDAEVKAAVADLLAPGADTSGMRFTLSERAVADTAADGSTVWSSPAFLTTVTFDDATFDDETADDLWLREMQDDLLAATTVTSPIGVAIDDDLSFEEALTASAPFIFLAVALIVLLVAFVHRSYWSAVMVMGGLGVTTLLYNGFAALIGLRMGSLLLAFIVPIAMISFGVDFYIHGVGRVREKQQEGIPGRGAYPAGMSAVFTAMFLAAATSVAAFMSNALSGIESIVEFGMGSALAIALAYIVLGHLAPRVLLGVEEMVGPNPVKRWSRLGYALAMVPVAILSGLAVALAAVMPQFGAAAVAVAMLVVGVVPALLTRRRNRRARISGRRIETRQRGAAHGLRPAGAVVHAAARWRVVTIPLALAIGGLGLVAAFNVTSGFELDDFLPGDSDFITSINTFSDHFPSSGEGEGLVYIEGDLTDPDTLTALDDLVDTVDGSPAGFGRNGEGQLIVGTHAADVARMALLSPDMVSGLAAEGVTLTDADGDGFPDTRDQVAAVFAFAAAHGVTTPGGELAIGAADVPEVVAPVSPGIQATAVRVSILSFTDGDIIVPAWDALKAASVDLQTIPGVTAVVTGDVIGQFESMAAFSNSMLLSLPVAIVLTLIIAGLVLRSVRFAIAAVIPIGFVVTGVYAFMYVAGFQINVVTATIAAIAVGVGIDFSTHLTARYREELAAAPDRLTAMRRTGEGTGGALVLSALTSVLGFTVMAFAPTPMFSTFGTLTAVMIGLALVASLTVLPAVLATVTRERRPQTPPRDIVPESELVGV